MVQHGLLRVPDLIPELVESNLGDVDAVDEDGAFGGFHDPEESEHQRRLPCSCPSDDPDFLKSMF